MYTSEQDRPTATRVKRKMDGWLLKTLLIMILLLMLNVMLNILVLLELR